MNGALLQRLRPEDEVLRYHVIDRTTGQLANPYCPPDVVMAEYFIFGTEPIQECTVHSPFNMGSPFDTTARPGSTTVKPATPKRDSTPNPFKIP